MDKQHILTFDYLEPEDIRQFGVKRLFIMTLLQIHHLLVQLKNHFSTHTIAGN